MMFKYTIQFLKSGDREHQWKLLVLDTVQLYFKDIFMSLLVTMVSIVRTVRSVTIHQLTNGLRFQVCLMFEGQLLLWQLVENF